MIALLDAWTNVTLDDCCNQALALIDLPKPPSLGSMSEMAMFQQLRKEVPPYSSSGGHIGFDHSQKDPSVESRIANRYKGQTYATTPLFPTSDYDRGDGKKPTRPKGWKPRGDFHDPHREREQAGDGASSEQTRQPQSHS